MLQLAQALCANETLETLSLRNVHTNAKDVDEFLKALTKVILFIISIKIYNFKIL